MINLVDFRLDDSFYQKIDEDFFVSYKHFPFSWTFDVSRQATHNYVRERENDPKYAK